MEQLTTITMATLTTIEGYLQHRAEVVVTVAPEVPEMKDVAGTHRGMVPVEADRAVNLTLEDRIHQMRTIMLDEETIHGRLHIRDLQYRPQERDIHWVSISLANHLRGTRKAYHALNSHQMVA